MHRNSLYSIALCVLLFAPSPASTTPQLELPTLPLNYCANTVSLNPPIFSEFPADQATTGETVYGYQTAFDSGDWSGAIRKFALTENQDGRLTSSPQSIWEAGAILNKSPASAQRHIVTYNRATQTTIPFSFRQLPAESQEIFNNSPNSDQPDNLGASRVDYLSGDRSMEKSQPKSQPPLFRIRKNILGDIVHSTAALKGAPTKEITDADYLPFYQQFEHRPATLYTGANDGMLHAFSAESGAELFAYIPGPLIGKLPALTDPAYQHAFYMDGNMRIDEARVRNSWKTVLAAGMGLGAKGIFALDVTAPSASLRDHGVLFEFTEKDDPDIGYVTAAPVIAKIKNGSGSDTFGYFIITAGGYNSSNADNDHFLFLISLDKSENTPWALGKNYFKLKTSGKSNLPNALSPPGLILNSGRAALFAYAGDLQGNLWRFDLSEFSALASISPVLLFSAANQENQAQPITERPVVVHTPGAGYLVIFGTGKYLDYADTKPENFISNSFYAIYDSSSTEKNNSPIQSRNELAKRTVSNSTQNGVSGFIVSGSDFTFNDNPENTKKGWYIDLPNSKQSGERSISEAVTAYGNVFFNTYIPNTNGCQNAGTSVSYKLDALTGKTAGAATLTGYTSPNVNLGTPALIVTTTSSGDRTATGKRYGTQLYTLLNFGNGIANSSGIIMTNDMAEITSGRLSWREIQNWQESK